ncbi:MAG: LacI family transcriptional regulator [Methylobacteriaceae bacterium]|jgi:LacI family transcriptional regulator|nr:LacI family transcriptional regulator [Methylobacteriaceae bacterium]
MTSSRSSQDKLPRATIKDIARVVGVSPTAVSLALNDKGSLTEDLRKRIKDTAAVMNYRPNSSARMLRGSRSNSVSVIINYFNNPFFRSFFLGLEPVLDEAGVTYSVSQTWDSLAKEQELARKAAEHGSDGLIVLNCSAEYAHLKSVSDTFSIPIVLISHTLEDRFAALQADNLRGGYLATEHLLSLDKRPVFHISGMPGKSGLKNRMLGFKSALADLRPEVNPESFIYPVEALTAAAGYQAMETILEHHKPPLGVFVVNDEVALGVVTYVRHIGLKMPEQVAVVGFSDIDLLETLYIPLTSIRIPQKRMGALAAQTLLDLIDHPENRLSPPILTLPVTLVVRESTIGPQQGKKR